MFGWRCYADSSQCSNVALEPTSCADTTLFTSSDIISLLLHRCSPAPTLSYLGFCLQQTRLIDNQQFVNFDLIDHDEVTDHDNWWSDPTLSYLGFCLQQTKLIDNQHQAITKCAKDLNPHGLNLTAYEWHHQPPSEQPAAVTVKFSTSLMEIRTNFVSISRVVNQEQ